MKKYMRIDEVAEELNVSISTIRRVIKDMDKPLPSVKIGGVIRIRRDDLEEYIKENTVINY